MRSFILLAAASVAAISAASAQATPIAFPRPGLSGMISASQLPDPGDLVRIEDERRTILTGVVVRQRNDSLWLQDRNQQESIIPRYRIRTVSTYATQWGKGAKRGAIVGAILGVATAGTALWLDTHGSGECICVPLSYVAVPAGLIGMPLLGTGVGLLFAPEGWSKPRIY